MAADSQLQNDLKDSNSDKTIPRMLGYICLMRMRLEMTIDGHRLVCLLQDFDTDIGQMHWKIESLTDPGAEVTQEATVTAAFSFGILRFGFSAQVLSRNQSVFVTTVPKKIDQLTSRAYERYPFSGAESSTVTIHFQDRHGSLTKSVATVPGRCISTWAEGGMGIAVPRDSGLFLAGDLLTKIEVKRNGFVVFDGQGEIMWSQQTEPFNGSWELGVRFTSAEEKKSLRPKEQIERDLLLCERSLERIRLNGGISSAFIRCKHPFRFKSSIAGVVHDLSTHGCSFLNEERELFLPVGSVLEDVLLQLPFHEPLKTTLALRHISTVDLQEGDEIRRLKKYGFEFLNPSSEVFRAIETLVMESRNRYLKEASVENLEELWRFFFETGFIYDEKRKYLAGKFDRIKACYEKLLSEKNNIFKKIVYRKNGQVYAHISSLANYDGSWLIQHLAANKDNGKSTSIDVVMAILDFFIQMYNELRQSASYIQFYYRPENFYPATIFGGSALRINSPAKVGTFPNGYYVASHAPTSDEALQIKEATDKDYDLFEKLVVRDLTPLQLRAEGLTREKMKIPETNAAYRAHGLEKLRTLLYLPSVGFATIDTSELGLNLSELTNVIRVFPESPKLTTQLVDQAWAWACREKHSHFTLLLRTDLEKHMKSKYFKKKCDYICWTLESGSIREFKSHVVNIFQELKKKSA